MSVLIGISSIEKFPPYKTRISHLCLWNKFIDIIQVYFRQLKYGSTVYFCSCFGRHNILMLEFSEP